MPLTVRSELTRRQINDLLRNLPGVLSGRQARDPLNLRTSFWAAYSHRWWTQVSDDFVIKSAGGRGRTGRWKPLTQKYKAYGRPVGKGDISRLKIGGRGQKAFARRERGLLTKAQNKKWKAIFASMLAKLAPSEGLGEAKKHAARIAWSVLKKEGAQTKLDTLGRRNLPIGIRTGEMEKAIQPGRLGGAGGYVPPRHQTYELRPRSVILGVEIPYVSGFHKRRPLWPGARSGQRTIWLAACTRAGRDAVVKRISGNG